MSRQLDRRIDVPLYTVSEAADHLLVPRSTFGTWTQGYVRPSRHGGRPVTGAPIVTLLQGAPRTARVPFIGLAEGYVLRAFKQAGVPLQRIRPALARLQKELGLEHALASRALYTDGAEVLYDYAEHQGDTFEAEKLRQLVVVRSDQRVFNEVVADDLQRITFGEDGYASLIRLPQYRTATVLVDPTRSFGAPIFARGGARVSDVVGMVQAGEGIEVAAEEYGVPVDEVEDAVRVLGLAA